MNQLVKTLTQRQPRSAIIAAMIVLGVVYGGVHLVWCWYVWYDVPNEATDMLAFNLGILHVSLFVYAAGRVVLFHPALNKSYRDWLATTPWSVERPLPFGPFHLVLDDLMFIGLCVGLSLLEGHTMVYLPLAFLLGRSAALVHVNYLAQIDWGVFVPVALLATGVPLFRYPLLLCVVAATTAIVAFAASRRGLLRFPWSDSARLESFSRRGDKNAQKRGEYNAAWPLVDRKRKSFSGQAVSYTTGAAIAALSGWCVFCLLYHASTPHSVDVIVYMLPFCVGMVLALMRTFYYCDGRPPSVGFMVRLTTCRPIVPGYDRVFLTPLLVVAVGAITAPLLLAIGLPPLAASAIGITGTVAVAFNAGPSLEEWNYTGHHHIDVSGVETQRGKQKQSGPDAWYLVLFSGRG